MRLFKRKRWYIVILIVIILALLNICASVYVRNSIKMERQNLNRIREAQQQATISEVLVCTKDEVSLPKQENSSMYVVPTNMERIYICGLLEISIPEDIIIYLYQNGNVITTSTSAVIKEGPFIIDVISTAALKGGVYRADLYIVRDKPAASVYFILKK